MTPKYNALNRINVNLEAAGICAVCGRRLSVCEHATPEQAEATRQMDRAIDTEYAMRSQYALAAAMITDVAPRLELALSIISDLELDGSLPSRVDSDAPVDAVDARRWMDEERITNWSNYPDFEDEPKETQPNIDMDTIEGIPY